MCVCVNVFMNESLLQYFKILDSFSVCLFFLFLGNVNINIILLLYESVMINIVNIECVKVY